MTLKRSFLILVIAAFLIPLFSYAQDFVAVFPVPATTIDTTDVDSYFGSLFIIFISIAIILAVIKLMICGISYMASESTTKKTAAKTCISHIVFGLFLILLSYLVLQTINKDFVDGTFKSITDRINVGDVSSISKGDTLDGISPDAENIPGINPLYRYSVYNVCTRETVSRALGNKISCEADLKQRLDVPRYRPLSSCEETASGDYSFTVVEIGYKCNGPNITKTFPPGVWPTFNATPCNDALQEMLDIENFALVASCIRI